MSSNPLVDGALATKPHAILIEHDLGGLISGLIRDTYGDLPPEVFPEKKLKKRYHAGIEGIMRHELLRSTHQKQVIVLFSHHKGIKHMFNWAGSKEKINDPDYCATLEFKVATSTTHEKGYEVKSCVILNQ
jgi:hypothetical protein